MHLFRRQQIVPPPPHSVDSGAFPSPYHGTPPYLGKSGPFYRLFQIISTAMVRSYPPFSGGYIRRLITYPPFFLISREASRKIPHILGDWFKNTPFSVCFFPRKKGLPFPEKMGICMRPPCTFVWGGGGWWDSDSQSIFNLC